MIKLCVFDFDGCFTNGNVYFDSFGNIFKNYNVKDGVGIKLLKQNNIKVGVISGYKENVSQLQIIKHLNLDYYSLGSNDKLNILKNWCLELNIDYKTEVAFMGDDINDIEVLESIKISGCPKDAHKNILNICDFISSKNGGDGCIREFSENVLGINNKTKDNYIIHEVKNELLHQLNNLDINDINSVANIISNTKNNVFFCGVGKSELMANYCCNLLKSIGIKAFYLNILNSTHGDIGTLKENDLVFLFSKSGNTNELTNIIPYLKQRKSITIGICCNNKSQFKSLCDKTVVLPFNMEINGIINNIPTNSSMMFLIFSNILVTKLSEKIGIKKTEYKLNHPAGNIGKNLRQIRDSLITEFPKIQLQINDTEKISLSSIFLEMTKWKIGCCFFIDCRHKLLGILTDGDIRRLLLETSDLKEVSIKHINKEFYFEKDINKFIIDLDNVQYIPILEDNNKLIGIVNKFN